MAARHGAMRMIRIDQFDLRARYTTDFVSMCDSVDPDLELIRIEIDLDLADYINFLVDDEHTTMIACLAEGIRRPQAFMAASS